KRWSLSRATWICLALAYLIGMTTAARVLFDLTHRIPFRVSDLVKPAYYNQGGLWGGPMVYLLVAAGAVRIVSNRPRGGDLVGVSLPIPLMYAKTACLANGCCYGSRCSWPWAIHFPAGSAAPPGVPLHPTQLYEIGALLATAFALRKLDREPWRGRMLAWF